MEEHHRRIAEIALSAAGKFSRALAGGYAIQAHGIGSRPSGDVDLFVNWARRDDFDAAVDAVIAALAAEGLQAEVIVRAETFARLLVADPARDGEPDKVEIAADWRSHDPVILDMALSWTQTTRSRTRWEPCTAGHWPGTSWTWKPYSPAAATRGRACSNSRQEADPGFDRQMYASALGALAQITDAAFDEGGISAEDISAMRRRFASWREDLLAS